MFRRSPCGERGLKFCKHLPLFFQHLRRSPCGERGLKFGEEAVAQGVRRSLPVRGAWIEMLYFTDADGNFVCRSPCGERGLKWLASSTLRTGFRRSPCGERGLKFCISKESARKFMVAPRAGSVD